MNYGLLLRTVAHLKFTQVFYQLKHRIVKPHFTSFEAPDIKVPTLTTAPIPRVKCREGKMFTFLNLSHEFTGWEFTGNGMLWAYNQNYFDWINQDGASKEDGCKWIDAFNAKMSENRIGLAPYPTALRIVNWVKFFCRYPDCATKPRLDSLFSQVKLLGKLIEYHLLGNHLLEDAFALYIGGSFFSDKSIFENAKSLLLNQLTEQILRDGAHYEQSPMYHCILLDRLLDCINLQEGEERRELAIVATKMLGHLESIVWKNGSIPMLNDSANGISPTPTQLFDYAKKLGLIWHPVSLCECGYRKLTSSMMEVIVDVGDITATYQPGHSHADTFTYELYIKGKPYIVDTGISTYNKTNRRQLERSTISHNCVSINGGNSTEVWGGFRVGRRCHTSIIKDTTKVIEAAHDGFGTPVRRKFEIHETDFTVEDWCEGEATSYIHLAEGVDERCIKISDSSKVEVKPWLYSIEYNRFIEGKVIEISFKDHCKYSVFV